MLPWQPVLALPFEINEDIRGVWNNSVVAAAAVRARSPDKQLVGQGNAPEYPGARGAVSTSDDGNLNYRKGDLISAPLIYTTDLELRYRNRFGVYGKARAWYDYVGENKRVPHGSVANGYQPDSELDDSDYFDYNKFSGHEVLDLYTYGNWDVGESRISARFGKQSINWGESLLHLGVNGFNPINFSALARAGARLDDALVPVNRLYGNLITRNGVSLEAFYALDWEASRIPPCGTFVSADSIYDGGCLFATAAQPLTDFQQWSGTFPAVPPFEGTALEGQPIRPYLVADHSTAGKPEGSGGHGLSSRYYVEGLDTEFGVYYVSYDATLPTISFRTCTGSTPSLGCTPATGFALPSHYQEDLQLFGLSAATGVQNMAFSAELSYLKDLPVQRNIPEVLEGSLGAANEGIYAERLDTVAPGGIFDGFKLADRTLLLLGTDVDLSGSTGLAQARLLAEVSGQWVDIPGTDEERLGRNGNWGAAAAPNGVCDPRTLIAEGCKADGFVTDFAWGYRLDASFLTPLPEYGIELIPRLAWSHDVKGYSADGSQVEGRQVFGVSLRTLFQRRFFVDIGRSWFKTDTDYDPVRDRDVYLVAVGLAF
jgi:hypothetical protein